MITQIIESCADQKSPIDGSQFQKLSKEYAALKKAETGSSKVNLDLTGDMLGSLDFVASGNTLEIGVYGSEAPKADGHNNFSGKSQLPQRKFLPEKGESFDSSITEMVNNIVQEYRADHTELSSDRLESINTSEQLYKYLESIVGEVGKARIKELALSSEWAIMLADYDLLDLL